MDAARSGVNLGTIGLFTLVGTPYTLKFLWAPLVDALNMPLLTRWLGRRRGWLVFSQLLLIAAILLLALTDPARSPLFVALGALLVATMSATQDIVVDAFRVESLPENEQAAGMASYVAAYRDRHAGLDRRRAVPRHRLREYRARAGSTPGCGAMSSMAALVLIGIVTALCARPSPSSPRVADAADTAESLGHARLPRPRWALLASF